MQQIDLHSDIGQGRDSKSKYSQRKKQKNEHCHYLYKSKKILSLAIYQYALCLYSFLNTSPTCKDTISNSKQHSNSNTTS